MTEIPELYFDGKNTTPKQVVDANKKYHRTKITEKHSTAASFQNQGLMTEISSFALINEFFLGGATERNTR